MRGIFIVHLNNPSAAHKTCFFNLVLVSSHPLRCTKKNLIRLWVNFAQLINFVVRIRHTPIVPTEFWNKLEWFRTLGSHPSRWIKYKFRNNNKKNREIIKAYCYNVGLLNMSVSDLITESYQRDYLFILMAHKANKVNLRQNDLRTKHPIAG